MAEQSRAKIELFGSSTCPYTTEVREQLIWDHREFVEYDVEIDARALGRMLELTGGRRMVPVVVEDGRVKQIGWYGLGCAVEAKM